MKDLSVGLRVFIIFLSVVAAIVFSGAVTELDYVRILWILLLGIVTMVADLVAVRTPSGVSISLSFTIILVAVATEGMPAGIVVAAIGAVGADLVKRKPWYKVLFNCSQFILIAWVTSIVLNFFWCGNWAWDPYGGEVVLAFLISGFIGIALNIALTAVPLALTQPNSYWRVIAEVGKSMLPVFPVQIVLAVILSKTFVAGQYAGCVLILTVLGWSFHSYYNHRRMVDYARVSSTLINHISIGIITVNEAGKVKMVNQTACVMFETTEQSAKDRNFNEILSQPYACILKETLQTGVLYKDYSVCSLDGKRYLLETVQFKNLLQKSEGAALIIQDITERERWEEQIRQTEKLSVVGQLAAGTAHEIRNPLTAVKGFIQLLNERLGNRGLLEEQDYTEVVMKEIERINIIVSEFMSLARPTQPDLRIIDIKSILDELAIFIESEALLRNITSEIRIYGESPLIVVEVDQIKQVFLNLVNNAFYAMPDGGKLRIVVNNLKDKGQVQIKFIDTGMGIPPEVQSHIFEPFYTTRDTGTGLGLTVTYRIIQNHGGKIEVASTCGQGTTFTVTLPIQNTNGQNPVI